MRAGRFDAALGAHRARVLESLTVAVARAESRDLARLLGVRGELLERARVQVAALGRGEATALAAWRRYRGVVWSHLAPATLGVGARRRLLVPSGLYGLTTGDDPVADYRLKMNVVLPGLGTLAGFWRPHVSGVLASTCAGATLVDLLPREHARALDPVVLGDRVTLVRVAFVTAWGEGAAGHAAKAVKGEFARRLLTEGSNTLERFSWEGWHLEGEEGVVRVVAPR